MFELSQAEIDDLVSQNVIGSKGFLGGALPMAFTEQGMAMLSSVLRSTKAVDINIAIMRTFVQLKRMLETNRELEDKITRLEKRYDQQFKVVFEAIKKLIVEESEPKKRIGYKKD